MLFAYGHGQLNVLLYLVIFNIN